MRTSVVSRWLIALCAVAAGLAFADRVGWAAAAGVDVWNLPALERQRAEQEDLDVRLGEQHETLVQRIETKEQLTAELIAGRTTLAEVTDRFEQMNRIYPTVIASMLAAYRAADSREANARTVLEFAAGHRFATPAARHAALRRLDAEFARLFPTAGTPMSR